MGSRAAITPPPPPGFVLEAELPPPPPGFFVEGAAPAAPAVGTPEFQANLGRAAREITRQNIAPEFGNTLTQRREASNDAGKRFLGGAGESLLGAIKMPLEAYPKTAGDWAAMAVGGPGGLMTKRTVESGAAVGQQAIKAGQQGQYGKATTLGLAAPIPMVGPTVQRTWQKAEAGDTAGALGGIAGDVAAGYVGAKVVPAGQRLVARIGKSYRPEPLRAITVAVKPKAGNPGFEADLEAVVPDLIRTGKPIGLKSLADTAMTARVGVLERFDTFFEPVKLATAETSAVARRKTANISERFREQNPTEVARIERDAGRYNRSMTLEQIKKRLDEVNNELESFYSKDDRPRSVARQDPSIAHTVAEAEALRDVFYESLERYAGPGARELYHRSGQLKNVEATARSRQKDIERKTLYEPGTLGARAEHIKRAALSSPIAPGRAIREVGRAVFEQQKQADTLIQKAFAQLGKDIAPQPLPTPSPRTPRGLLTTGDIITPDPQRVPRGSVTAVPGEYAKRRVRGLLEAPRPQLDRPKTPASVTAVPGEFATPTIVTRETVQQAQQQLTRELGRAPSAAEVQARLAILRAVAAAKGLRRP